MFSELLNWTGVGSNFSLIEDQIDEFTFLNNYNDEALEILLQYEDEIKSLTLAAQDTLDLFLPSVNTSYRIKSKITGEYLTDWEELDTSNKTISFGYYEDDYSEVDLELSAVTGADLIILLQIAGIVTSLFIFMMRTVKNQTPTKSHSSRADTKRPTSKSSEKNPINAFRK